MIKEIRTGLMIDWGFITAFKMGRLEEGETKSNTKGVFNLSLCDSGLDSSDISLHKTFLLAVKSCKFELKPGDYIVRIFFEGTSDKIKIEEQSMQVQIKEGMITVLKYALGSNYKSSLEFSKFKNTK